MWRLSKEIFLSEHALGALKLKIPRNSCFKICSAYYHDYNWEKGNNSIFISVFSNLLDKDAAFQECISEMTKSNRILSYLYNVDIGVHIYEYHGFKLVANKDCTENMPNSRNLTRIANFLKMYQMLPATEQTYFLRCVDFYSRGLYLHYNGLNEEGILNIFKVTELISGRYLDKIDFKKTFSDHIRRQFEQLIKDSLNETYDQNLHSGCFQEIKTSALTLLKNVSRRMKLTIEGLKVNISCQDVNLLIKFRNNIAAHGNSTIYSDADLNKNVKTSIILSSELISRFFFDKDFKDIQLEINWT